MIQLGSLGCQAAVRGMRSNFFGRQALTQDVEKECFCGEDHLNVCRQLCAHDQPVTLETFGDGIALDHLSDRDAS